MRIALDFDQTVTLDPEFWRAFIRLAQDAGHDIRIVTARDDKLDRTAMVASMESLCPVIYTRGIAKRWFCGHFGGNFQPDVWIDDRPEAVIANSPTTPEDLARWREERNEGESIAP